MRLILIGVIAVLFFGLVAILRAVKGLPGRPILHLLLYGGILAIPFITLEFLSGHIGPFLLLPIILLEFSALFCEEHVRFLEEKMRESLAHLGLFTYLFIGLGFSFTEVGFFVLHTHDFATALAYAPFKTVFASVVHTTLFISVGVTSLGHRLWNYFKYYAEVAHIGVSHFLYLLFIHHHMAWLFVPIMVFNLILMRHHLGAFKEHLHNLRLNLGLA